MSRSVLRPRPKTRGLGILPALAALLVGSAALRTLEGENIAQVRGLFEAGPAHAADTPQTPTDEIGEVLSALKQREAELDAREARLDDREEVVEEGEVELSRQMGEIADAESRLRKMVNLADKASETDVETLVAVYENMKPEQAAPLFQQMPPAFAAGFLSKMQPPISAEILAAMPADAAYAVSVVLAGRNAGTADTE